MPQVLMNSGLTEALTEFANRINRTGKIQVSIQAFDVNPQMSAQQKSHSTEFARSGSITY